MHLLRIAPDLIACKMDPTLRGQAPYGYRWEGGELCTVPEEVRVRRRAFELFLNLKSLSGVARALNDEGDATRRGKRWSDVQVARILECPSAVGRYETRRTGISADGTREPTPQSGPGFVECEAIIPKETWDRACAMLAERRGNRQGAEEVSLSGLIRCACGEGMRSVANAVKFACSSCSTSISTADLEAVFGDDFASVIGTHPTLAQALIRSPEERQAAQRRSRVSEELSEARKEREGAERMLLSKAITQKRFEAIHAPLEAIISELERELAGLTAKTPASGAAEKVSWPALWSSFPSTRRQQIIKTFVDGFVVAADEIEIKYLLPDPSDHPRACPEL
jgi:site-specific DNA recombinase